MATYGLNEAYAFTASRIRQICNEYGLYGNLFCYSPSKAAGANFARFYVIAGSSKELESEALPKWLYPDELLRNQQENEKLFITNIWVYDMTGESTDVQAIESLVEYLQKVEFLRLIYTQYNAPFPKVLRFSEISQLYTFWQWSMTMNGDALKKARNDLEWFFKREKSRGFRRSWLDYFRTDKFPDSGGPFARILGYIQRNNQVLPLKQLLAVNSNVKKLEMQNYEYKLFAERVKRLYPQLTYSVGKVDIVDHGEVGNAPETYAVLGKRVTAEEYARIRKECFAKEGWPALANLQPARWEFQDVYYKECDEALVFAAYYAVTLDYAECNDLSDMYGDLIVTYVPHMDFMNFVSLAKANGLKFHIDGLAEYAPATPDFVPVLYSEHQTEKLYGIYSRLTEDKVAAGHWL